MGNNDRVERSRMPEIYDAAIVGAGLGGLTAAAHLMHEGLRVLVVEGDPHPGGTAYAYHRGGFGFPMGPLGFSNPGLVLDILRGVGIREELELKRVHYRLRAFGLEVPLSLPYPVMVRELSRLFPDEREGIKRFFEDMESLSSTLEAGTGEGEKTGSGLPDISASDYLEGLVKDERLRRILGGMGSREPYSGLPLLAAMWSLLCGKGIHCPREGVRRLADLLAAGLGWESRPIDSASPGEVHQDRGGESRLLLRREAAEISVRKGRARGIVLEDGTRVETGGVISNADYKATFLGLLHPAEVPPEMRKAVSSARQTASNLQVCLGLDASEADLSAFSESSRIIYRRGEGFPDSRKDPDWSAAEISPGDLAGDELEITLISADDPQLAPGGGAVLVIRVAAEHSHFTSFRPRWGRRTSEYLGYKTRLAEALIEEAAGVVPGLVDAARVMDVATPLTFEERGGRSEGAVAGWSWDYSDNSGESTRELVLTPIQDLFMAGYQAFSNLALGGIPSAMLSGLKAAEYLLEGASPASEISIPGA